MKAAASASERAAISRATLADLERLTALHLECLGRDANLASLFGAGFVRAAYRWLLCTEEAFVLKASIGGETVGFTSVCDVLYTLPMLKACRKQVLLSLLRRPWLVLHPRLLNRLRPRGTGLGRSLPGVAQVAFTAVSPQHRGRGVGASLKRASIRHCRERGKRGMLTGINADNVASAALNERFGFRRLNGSQAEAYHYYLLLFSENVQGEPLTAGPASIAQEDSPTRLQGFGT